MLNDLAHGLSWIGLAATTTPWLCATVSNLLAILDARLWRDDTADCEIWVGYRHGFWKYVITTSRLIHGCNVPSISFPMTIGEALLPPLLTPSRQQPIEF
ncbi:hypothetical protein TIFTF001_028590 [Ficus carica]|uniref:Uncharacterized protein n=1 Tax=Ficus carica TaxID=3494 RepID=A0AA88DQ71_FICCA|nr:hypothetical protein TIFTF001_028590 [Ficus carica]